MALRLVSAGVITRGKMNFVGDRVYIFFRDADRNLIELAGSVAGG